jgi:SulP family sulfate permease
MDEDTDLAFSMATLGAFFDPHTLPLWVRSFKLRTFGLIPPKQTIPLGLAVVLRLITIKFNHPLIIPGFFLLVGVVFYIVTVAIMHIPVQQLREAGWIFDLGNVDNEWYESYTEFGEWCSNLGSVSRYPDLRNTDWKALFTIMPTQLALVFFAMLHIPLNLPALSLSIKEDNLDADRELVNHGLSNLLAGLVGSIPNYRTPPRTRSCDHSS